MGQDDELGLSVHGVAVTEACNRGVADAWGLQGALPLVAEA